MDVAMAGAQAAAIISACLRTAASSLVSSASV